MTKPQLKGSWTDVKALKQKHCQLTVDDLKFTDGKEASFLADLANQKRNARLESW